MSGNTDYIADGFKRKLATAVDEAEVLRHLATYLRRYWSVREVVIYLPDQDGELEGRLCLGPWDRLSDAAGYPAPADLDQAGSETTRTPQEAVIGTDWQSRLQFIRAPIPLPDGRSGRIEVRKDLYASEWPEHYADYLVELARYVGGYL